MIIGAHVSISGGIDNAVVHAESVGCETYQIFTKNQSQWRERQFSVEEISKYRSALLNSGQQSDTITAHGSYLINLSSPDREKLKKSRQAFLLEINRCNDLKIPYLIFHPGSHLGEGEDWAINEISESLSWAIEKSVNQRVKLLLETTAGQGSNMGYRPEQLRKIIDLVGKPGRLGVCLDTCHMFAAGYDLRKNKYAQTMQHVIDQLDQKIICAFHLNDSKKELGSRVDRHEVIGEGFLGEETFRLLMNDERFSELPGILEIPGGLEVFEDCLKKLKSFRLE